MSLSEWLRMIWVCFGRSTSCTIVRFSFHMRLIHVLIVVVLGTVRRHWLWSFVYHVLDVCWLLLNLFIKWFAADFVRSPKCGSDRKIK
ncbi:hypothetical protein BGW37DRAFT_502964 [Umbelopsis sp. PMI_123]|nr:hypothetical protein BGW37DRAFT_502964 [Umbelopsis sp. PMI_123]